MLLLAAADKIPYTDAGIAQVESQVRAQLDDGITAGGIAPEPYTVTVPKAAAAAPADRAARILRNVKFSARLAGAIQKIVIQGVLTV